MFIQMKKTLGTPDKAYLADTVYNVDDERATDWVARGLAFVSKTPPPYALQLLDRLSEGADRPVVFLPFVGEFGHEVMSHMRIVHFHKAPVKVVCCRPGDEVLYPSASEFVTDWQDPVSDSIRCGTGNDLGDRWQAIKARYPGYYFHLGATGLDRDQEMFAIHPDRRIEFHPRRRGFHADVVFGVRERKFAPEKNWAFWPNLAHAAMQAGLTFAVIGHRSTSIDLPGQLVHSGDYDTDLAVELLQNCSLYVGTDSGGSHLASTVDANMLIFRENVSGMRDFVARMMTVNPNRIQYLKGAWMKPDTVATEMLALSHQVVAHG